MNDEEKFRKIIESAQAFSEPIDFEALIKEGALIKIGRSYYVQDIHLLPKKVSMRIKETASTKNGLRVTFFKEKKGLKKIADKFKDYLK